MHAHILKINVLASYPCSHRDHAFDMHYFVTPAYIYDIMYSHVCVALLYIAASYRYSYSVRYICVRCILILPYMANITVLDVNIASKEGITIVHAIYS